MYIKKAKLAVFSLLSQLFSVKLNCEDTLILYWFYPPKYVKHPLSKVLLGYFGKITEISVLSWQPNWPHNRKKYTSFIWVLLGIYNFHRCPVGGQTKSGSKAPFIVLCIFCQRCLSPSQIIQAKKYRDL